jgi:small subunit ribosomal protein S1
MRPVESFEPIEETKDSVTDEGDIVEAIVRSLESDHAIVEIKEGREGIIPSLELGRSPVQAGAHVRVLIEQAEPGGKRLIVSKEKAERLDLWRNINQAFDDKKTVEGEIIARIEGGFSVDIGVRAFLPASQLDVQPARDPDRYLGQRLHFRIIKFHRNRGNIVLSRRVLLEEVRQRTMEKLQPGEIVEGVVKSFTDYGAFIDLGGVQGLLHVTDMSWGRVHHPSEILTLGDPIRVKVLKVDPASQRVSLGLRQMQEDPWLDADKKYAVGTEVNGAVISITDYGVFLALEPGVEGLLHTTGALGAPAKEIVRRISIGDEIRATVLETDIAKKRISLGLKAS